MKDIIGFFLVFAGGLIMFVLIIGLYAFFGYLLYKLFSKLFEPQTDVAKVSLLFVVVYLLSKVKINVDWR